jgi:hypothetical protein
VTIIAPVAVILFLAFKSHISVIFNSLLIFLSQSFIFMLYTSTFLNPYVLLFFSYQGLVFTLCVDADFKFLEETDFPFLEYNHCKLPNPDSIWISSPKLSTVCTVLGALTLFNLSASNRPRKLSVIHSSFVCAFVCAFHTPLSTFSAVMWERLS